MLDVADLDNRLADIRRRYPVAEPKLVADVVRAVLATMRGDLTGKEAGLLVEVEELGRTILRARSEIAALRVDDITLSHIPSATDELDAIVAHTAAATDSILEVCETLDGVASALAREERVTSDCERGDEAGIATPAAASPRHVRLQDATTRIYEACSFQDITGQRITKVVTTLKAIETKVNDILGAFGHDSAGPASRTPERVDPKLLNGPQLPSVAMDQGDIDKLLASFD